MSKGLFFWLVFIVGVLIGAWVYWPSPGPFARGLAIDAFELLLIGILGWGAFGRPVQ